MLLGDSITTDHISPAGVIKEDSSAGKYLNNLQIIQVIIILLVLEEEIMKLWLEGHLQI